MKHIVKQSEPQSFTNWKLLSNADWQPSYAILRNPIKDDVKKALMREQGYICCYCERRLKDHDSHIEHFHPQHDHDEEALDFANMLCSCQQRIEKGEPRHCGNLKDDWFDEQLMVSPFDPECGKRFAFSGRGVIRAASEEDHGATETIRRLGLDSPKLNAMRGGALAPFLDDEISSDEFVLFVRDYLRMDDEGMFGEFWTMIQHLFGDAETV